MNALGFAKTLRALAAVPSQVAKESAGAINDRWEATFAAGQDPYGQPWAALAASTILRKGSSLPGTDSGAMRASTMASPAAGAGIQLSVGVPYAEYFDRARRLMPDNGLPAPWRADLQEVYSRLMRKGLGK